MSKLPVKNSSLSSLGVDPFREGKHESEFVPGTPSRKELDSTISLLAAIKKRRFTPPPGTPSSTELLREDRQR